MDHEHAEYNGAAKGCPEAAGTLAAIAEAAAEAAPDATFKEAIPYSPFLEDVVREMRQAEAAHPPLNSLHEAYGVIAEEVSEFFAATCRKSAERDHRNIREELVQVVAVCWRTARDLGYESRDPDPRRARCRLRDARAGEYAATYIRAGHQIEVETPGGALRLPAASALGQIVHLLQQRDRATGRADTAVAALADVVAAEDASGRAAGNGQLARVVDADRRARVWARAREVLAGPGVSGGGVGG